MARRIREDHKEYRDIIHDNVKSKLKDFIKNGRRLVRRGKDWVQINIPTIDLPSFRYGNPHGEGVANGDVEIGQDIANGPQQGGGGGDGGKGGDGEGEHVLGVGIPLDYFVELLGEELELPKLKPKHNANNYIEHVKYNRISRHGNNSLLHKKRTFKNALKRVMSTKQYNPRDLSNVYPIKEDKEYKSWSVIKKPDINAVIFFMADISASMTPDKRELIQELCWYLELWIRQFYDDTHIKYVVHDTHAHEVDQEKFYGYTSGGGTRISSAFEMVNDIIDAAYPLDEWNIYCFYLSDGESWGTEDNEASSVFIKELQSKCNVIGVTEVKGMRAYADFLPYIKDKISSGYLDEETVATAEVNRHEDVLDALQSFLTVGQE